MGGCSRARALQLAGPQSRPQARRVPVGRGAQHARGCLQTRRAGVAKNRGAKHTGRGHVRGVESAQHGRGSPGMRRPPNARPCSGCALVGVNLFADSLATVRPSAALASISMILSLENLALARSASTSHTAEFMGS